MSIVYYGYLVFILAVFTQLAFLLIYFDLFATHKSKRISAENSTFLPVTVLIVVKNEKSNLEQLVPLLVHQDYPGFEIFIMDDHSTDGTDQWIATYSKEFPLLKYFRLTNGQGGKKQALRTALHLISGELILLTDADCRPHSSRWIKRMVNSMTPETAAVLGYSPYVEQPGLLNDVIRLETAYTASLYFSFALLKHPYMGVGRNLLYRKQSLIQHFKPENYPGIPSGDDDLTINSMPADQEIAIQYESDAWMYSIPKSNWKAWLDQKKRHLSTARYYKRGDQTRLMFYYSSLVGSWIMGLGMGLIHPWMWLIWFSFKGWTYFYLVRPCVGRLGVSFSLFNWLRAELIYVVGLIYLFPFSTVKKWDKW